MKYDFLRNYVEKVFDFSRILFFPPSWFGFKIDVSIWILVLVSTALKLNDNTILESYLSGTFYNPPSSNPPTAFLLPCS